MTQRILTKPLCYTAIRLATLQAALSDRRVFKARIVLAGASPDVTDNIAIAKRLNQLLRHKSEESLDGVLDKAVGAPLQDFAASLRRHFASSRPDSIWFN